MKMKKTFATLLLTSATFFGIQNISAQETAINAAESTIHWLGKKVTGQHEGNIMPFGKVHASINFEAKKED